MLLVIPLFLHNIRMPVKNDIISQRRARAKFPMTLIGYFVCGIHMEPTSSVTGQGNDRVSRSLHLLMRGYANRAISR